MCGFIEFLFVMLFMNKKDAFRDLSVKKAKCNKNQAISKPANQQ
ncbi:hypothetical protein SAMN05428947_11429 [Mucilaginibacter sp. OK283]|jgi:hypothetical protein|nr:hypothetical protein SAMN05428947_11429 [Mucilaginibacter sp. OK283]